MNMIRIETPENANPRTRKFYPGKAVRGDKAILVFNSAAEALTAPIAKALFRRREIETIMYGDDFIAVTVKQGFAWDRKLETTVSGVIRSQQAKPFVMEEIAVMHCDDLPLSPTAKQIREFILGPVKAALAADGGDIRFLKFDEASGTVFINMRGACGTCNLKELTSKETILKALRERYPTVRQLQQLTDAEFNEELRKLKAEQEKSSSDFSPEKLAELVQRWQQRGFAADKIQTTPHGVAVVLDDQTQLLDRDTQLSLRGTVTDQAIFEMIRHAKDTWNGKCCLDDTKDEAVKLKLWMEAVRQNVAIIGSYQPPLDDPRVKEFLASLQQMQPAATEVPRSQPYHPVVRGSVALPSAARAPI